MDGLLFLFSVRKLRLRPVVWVLVTALAWLTAQDASAAIQTTSALRAVSSQANLDMDSVSSPAFGTFLETVQSSETTAEADLFAESSQDSFTPDSIGPLMSGVANLLATADVPGTEGAYDVIATASAQLDFVVTVTGIYNFSGSVSFNSNQSTSDTSELAFTDETNTLNLAFLLADESQASDSVNTNILLTAGINYRIEALARLDGDGALGDFDATASWEFNLVPEQQQVLVPEPSSFMLMAGLGIFLSGAVHRRRFTSRQRRES